MAAPPEYKTGPPPKAAASPGHGADFEMPPAKRARTSPQPTTAAAYPQAQGNVHHISPYANLSPSQSAPPTPSLYNNQNSTSAAPRYDHSSSLPQSPHFANVNQSQNTYNTPYGATSTAASNTKQHQPQFAVQNFSQPYSSPQQNYGPSSHQSQNQFAQSYNSTVPNHSNQMAGNMGPPMKPPEKPHEEDQTDVLAGTGVDLREEEAYAQNQFAFVPTQPAGHASKHAAGGPDRLYAASLSATPGENTNGMSQQETEQLVRDDAFEEAARMLAKSRQEELGDPFSQPKFMMMRMDLIAREEGVRINTRNGNMGRLIVPGKDYNHDIRVQTAVVPGGEAIMATGGPILPVDNLVVDQLILLSLATKYRTRQLLEDVFKIAKGRQAGSSGIVPAEWSNLAVQVTGADGTLVSPDAARTGWESAVSPRSCVPMKRPHSSANRLPTPISDGAKTPNQPKVFANEIAKAFRESAKKERQAEEERIKKRIARNDGTMRNGSVAPGTPGSAASHVGQIAMKGPSKKEVEKRAKEKKREEAATNVSANATSRQFLGGKKSKYGWMNTAPAGAMSKPTLPRLGTASATSADLAAVELTAATGQRLGNWREDKGNGLGIQMRDWTAVLEADGSAHKALARAYLWLDGKKPQKDGGGFGDQV